MTDSQVVYKRIFDILLSFSGLMLLGCLILFMAAIAYFDTGLNGFFSQVRVGREGKLFKIYKIRSMIPIEGIDTNVTSKKDPRISKVGAFLRASKLDELPQLWNVLLGRMSFVGPRPDIPGFADNLEGEDRKILTLRPGITGLASLYFKNEEELLSEQVHPEKYNNDIIWPAKVKINLFYAEEYSLSLDIKVIIATITPFYRQSLIDELNLVLAK